MGLKIDVGCFAVGGVLRLYDLISDILYITT